LSGGLFSSSEERSKTMSFISALRRQYRALGLAALAVGAVGVYLLSSGAARAETLEESLADSYNNNPQILSERARLRVVDENVPQALANWRPTVQLTGSVGAETVANSPYAPALPTCFAYVKKGAPPPLVPGTCIASQTFPSQLPAYANLTPGTVDVNITQPVFRGFRTVAQTAQAEKQVESERAHLIATEETVFMAVIQAYLDCVRDQSTLDLTIKNEQLLSKQLESTEDQFKVGTLTRTDVAQAQAQLAGAVADRDQAEGNLQVSRANFERAVGHPPEKLEAPKLRPVLPATRDEALTLAAKKNPNVISALFAEDAARDQVNVIRGQLLPTVSIVGDYTRQQNTQAQNREFVASSIVARMTMPLYEGGAIFSATRQAQQTVGQLKGVTDDTRRASVQGATQAWETVVAARARRIALRETVKAAEVAFEGIRQEQMVGTRTLLDVLITEQQLFGDEVSLVTTEHDLSVSEFNLSEQIGRLTAVDLNLGVKLYDVDAHYREVRDKWAGFGSQE